MKLSKYFFRTLKEAPGDADIESQKLFIRGNFIKKLAPGSYTYMPLGLRSLRKFENIVREEMNRAGAIELLMPMVQPRELWEETGRWEIMGKGLMRMKDRNEHEFCLGATHEEVITDIARKEIQSYRDLPLSFYQIQTKYRDEIRPRFGLMRGKEFLMKDAYSFDVSKEKALESYWNMYHAYQRIFARCGLEYRVVKADAGAIGGSLTHEFQVLAQSGEDLILACDNCDYASNIEITPSVSTNEPIVELPETLIFKSADFKKFSLKGVDLHAAIKHEEKIQKFDFKEAKLKPASDKGLGIIFTPGLKTIEDLAKFLKTESLNLAKTLFFRISDDRYLCVMVRGDDELNPIKLKNALGLSKDPELCNEGEVMILSGAAPGSCGPIGLNLGLKIEVIVDDRLKNLKNWVVGANLDHFHLFNVNPEKDFSVTMWADLRKVKEGNTCPECGVGKLRGHRGIEVGHIFYLGDKYSKVMKSQFLDEAGKANNCEMGCYGIGVSRTIQAAIEQSHDKDGMIWPLSLAPFQVLICLIDIEDAEIKAVAEEIYQALVNKGVEVLMDDRNERPGSKFKDADLVGIPLRVNVGKKSFAESGSVELIERKTKAMEKVIAKDAVSKVLEWIKKEKAKTDLFVSEITETRAK